MTIATVIQQAIYERLTQSTKVVELVPVANILDRNDLPKANPLILIGEDQIVDDESDLRRTNWRIYSTIHVWKIENGLIGIKLITGAIIKAINSSKPALDVGFQCIDWRVSNSRFIRDNDGIHSHAIISVSSLVSEVTE